MSALIVLDLEFNTGAYGTALEEVIQIGAVHITKPGGVIDGHFNAYIMPHIHKRWSRYAKLLPEFQRSVDSRLSFEDAYMDFLEWCRGETEFGEWGRGDFSILARNAMHHGLPIDELPTSYADIQAAFSRMLGSVNSIQLYYAVEYCQIPDSFVFHNALNDAVYAALVSGYVDSADMIASIVHITDRDLHPIMKPRMPSGAQTRLGPFVSRDLALNNMGCRRAVCPKCREMTRVSAWHTSDGQYYYASFHCREHGLFIRKLQLIRQPDGRWWTYNDVLPPTPQNLSLLSAAEASQEFPCKSRRSAAARRRKKR